MAFVALWLLVPAASVGAWAGMIGGAGEVWGKAVYAAAKVWLVGLPVMWLIVVERGKPRLPRLRGDGMWPGVISGLAIFGAIVGGYWFLGRGAIDRSLVVEKINEIGLDSAFKYWAMAAYITFVNAMVEEYVWRWFVAGKCEALLGKGWLAIVLAAICFTAHHVIVLDVYFGPMVVMVGAVGVFIGGAVWSALYIRYRNIFSPYVSHLLADAAIFLVGWHMIVGR